MNRRQFLSANAAALLASRLPGAPAALPRAKWIENGIIDAGGSHEPLTFVIRRGGQRPDSLARYQQARRRQRARGAQVSSLRRRRRGIHGPRCRRVCRGSDEMVSQ
jgi:hypothetical protein